MINKGTKKLYKWLCKKDKENEYKLKVWLDQQKKQEIFFSINELKDNNVSEYVVEQKEGLYSVFELTDKKKLYEVKEDAVYKLIKKEISRKRLKREYGRIKGNTQKGYINK